MTYIIPYDTITIFYDPWYSLVHAIINDKCHSSASTCIARTTQSDKYIQTQMVLF